MQRRWLIATALLATSLGGVAQADSLAYVRASSQHLRTESAAKYHPLNLLDDNASTMWCEGAEGLGEGEEIRFEFKRRQRIDRIVIGPASGTGRLVNIVKVSDGANTIRIQLSDAYAERPLKRPLSGTTYVVSIEEVGGPNEGAELEPDKACLSEVLLYFKNRLFGGRTPTSKLRYNARRDKVLGRWNGAPLGASESFILFALDGTWEWTFVPLLGGKTERMTGEYRFRGNRLLMRRGETGRWADMGFTYKRVEVDADDIGAPLGDYDLITLNRALGGRIKGEFNNAEFE